MAINWAGYLMLLKVAKNTKKIQLIKFIFILLFCIKYGVSVILKKKKINVIQYQNIVALRLIIFS